MQWWQSLLAYAGMLLLWTPALAQDASSPLPDTAYEFTFISIDGAAMPLSQYRGRAILIVNVASKCGFVNQYAELQTLWETFRERGLVVIAVPSNDFDNQEPGTEAEIKQFAQQQFQVSFPMTSKVSVIGERAHPFFSWVVAKLGTKARPVWNFHKYLIGPDGTPKEWFFSFTPATSPRIVRAIEANLPKGYTPLPEPKLPQPADVAP